MSLLFPMLFPGKKRSFFLLLGSAIVVGHESAPCGLPTLLCVCVCVCVCVCASNYIYRYRYIGEGPGTPLQYSCLENPMDGGAWWAAVHGVAKSRTRLSNFAFTFHFPALEKEMATHSSVLAWRIPGTGEPGGLLSMGSHKVGHD